MSESEAVVARLTLAAARLKAIQEEANDVVAGIEVPTFGDIKVTRLTPPKPRPQVRASVKREDPLTRLAVARSELAQAGAELGTAHDRLGAAEDGLSRLLRG